MPRILIVDDEPAVLSVLATAFRRAGYTVGTADNGRTAVDRVTSDRYDVVLTDVVMPSMDGHELVKWIAANAPDTRTAMMSGFDSKCPDCVDPNRCRRIAKPFRPAEVVQFVAGVLA